MNSGGRTIKQCAISPITISAMLVIGVLAMLQADVHPFTEMVLKQGLCADGGVTIPAAAGRGDLLLGR